MKTSTFFISRFPNNPTAFLTKHLSISLLLGHIVMAVAFDKTYFLISEVSSSHKLSVWLEVYHLRARHNHNFSCSKSETESVLTSSSCTALPVPLGLLLDAVGG